MPKKLRTVLFWVLGIGLCIFLALTAWQVWGYFHAQATAEEAMRLAGLTQVSPEGPQATVVPADSGDQEEEPMAPLEEAAEFLLDIQLIPLKEKNPDVIGWICVPDSNISYPLLQGDDNSYYLKHAWDGSSSSAGSIFMEQTNDPNFLDYNTILYGHHMKNGSSFAQVTRYRNEDWQQTHQYIYIVTAHHIRRYTVFSAYEAPVSSETYRINFSTPEKKQAALDSFVQSSLYDTGILPDADSPILTLSTCVGNGTYSTRFVVQATLTGIWIR